MYRDFSKSISRSKIARSGLFPTLLDNAKL